MRLFGIITLGILMIGLTGLGGFLLGQRTMNSSLEFINPFVSQEPERPLLAYTIDALSQHQYPARTITIDRVLVEEDEYTSYIFSFRPLDRTMTGVINVPTSAAVANPGKAIVMLRGYVPPEIYEPGVGTKNAAAYFARNGYITVAPDFFGYGESDSEPSDVWQARFEKPIVVAELLATLQQEPLLVPDFGDPLSATIPQIEYPISGIGIWAHSNGGQIALTTLEVTQHSIPTTLWAPVTAPFPYSILFFTDENADEGKASRKWVSLFEELYDAFDFSLTQHLDHLAGPLQLHHGTADEAALIEWSDEFVQKLENENLRRSELATPSAEIDFTYYRYPGSDHNLQPAWNTVIERDLVFFNRELLE